MIFFDFDGVVADSFSAAFAVSKMLHPHLEKADYVSRFDGNINEAIAKTFGLRYPWPPSVKVVDLKMLRTEVDQLMPPTARDWEIIRGIDPLPVNIRCWTPKMAKEKFLKRFNALHVDPVLSHPAIPRAAPLEAL